MPSDISDDESSDSIEQSTMSGDAPTFSCANPSSKLTIQWGTELVDELKKQFEFFHLSYAKIDHSINTQFVALNKTLRDKVKATNKIAVKAQSAAEANATAIAQIRDELSETRQELKLLKLENDKLRDQANKLETYSRRDNILFYGIQMLDNETSGQCDGAVRSFMKDRLKMSADVVNDIVLVRCHRLHQSNKKFPPPIIARFKDFRQRELVWGCLSALPKKSGSFMSEDYPSDVRYNRRKLLPVFAKARSTLNIPKSKITLKNDVLHIDKQKYTVSTLGSLTGDLHPKSFSRKTNETVMVAGGIFSDYDPLTNYYKHPLKHKDMVFSSLEHGYVYYKCLAAKHQAAADSVMHVPEPFMAKRIGSARNLKSLDTKSWDKEKDKIMHSLLVSKFVKGGDMAKELLSTGNRRLGEAGLDTYYGIGVSITDKNVLDPEKWTGENRLGTMLMNIRDSLR